MGAGFAAEKLKAARLDRSWKQADLAEKVGVSKWSVCQWERGHDVPRASNLAALAAALGVTPAELCADELPASLGEARYRAGYTQATLGQRVGTSESTVAAVEAGHMSMPGRLLDKWAAAVGVAASLLSGLLPD